MSSRLTIRCLRPILITGILTVVLASGADANPRFMPRLFPRHFRAAESLCPLTAPSMALPPRNMVNLVDRNLPTTWSAEEGKFKNIKWSADLGHASFGSPVVAHGKVFVATNNRRPRDPKVKQSKAVLMAFRENDGKFLWQNVHDILGPYGYRTSGYFGLLSTPAVDGRRLYYVTPRVELICADCEDGKVHWGFDMMKELGVVPYYCNICSPLVVGDLVFVVTANGINEEEGKVAAPNPKIAP
ncbi:MAG: hypothetical protein EXR98_17135 [Gemmataceae bacterium]|nr:hypothetical protein [Gemmataceae bacterium]